MSTGCRVAFRTGIGTMGIRYPEIPHMLSVDIQDGIHVLTLDHGKVNALDMALCDEISDIAFGLAGGCRGIVWR